MTFTQFTNMYYIGTITQVERYIRKVDKSESYQGTTNSWSIAIKHPIHECYAVIKHKKYNDTEMQLLEKLPEDWQPKDGI